MGLIQNWWHKTLQLHIVASLKTYGSWANANAWTRRRFNTENRFVGKCFFGNSTTVSSRSWLCWIAEWVIFVVSFHGATSQFQVSKYQSFWVSLINLTNLCQKLKINSKNRFGKTSFHQWVGPIISRTGLGHLFSWASYKNSNETSSNRRKTQIQPSLR